MRVNDNKPSKPTKKPSKNQQKKPTAPQIDYNQAIDASTGSGTNSTEESMQFLKEANDSNTVQVVQTVQASTQPSQIVQSRAALRAKMEHTFISIMASLMDIFAITIYMMKYPFAFILFAYGVNMMLSHTSHNINLAISNSLDRLCTLPVLTLMPTCHTQSKAVPHIESHDFSDVARIQMNLDTMLASTGATTGVATKVMHTGFAISDLKRQIMRSDLVYKSSLTSKLDEIETAAGLASEQLSDLEVEVNGVIYSFLATDSKAIEALESIKQSEKPKPIFPLSLFRGNASPTRDEVVKVYNLAATQMEKQLETLISTAEITKKKLKTLGMSLDALGDGIQDGKTHEKEKNDELLAMLWTKLGGNYEDRVKFENNLALLSELSEQHSMATSIVRGTLGELQSLKAQLSRLRKGVFYVGDSNSLDHHLDTLRGAVIKLKDDQSRAKRLEDEAYRQMHNPPQRARIQRA